MKRSVDFVATEEWLDAVVRGRSGGLAEGGEDGWWIG